MPTRGGVILPNEPAGASKPEVAGFFRSGSTVRHAAGVVQVDPDSHDPIIGGGYPVSFELAESFAYFTAGIRMSRIMWRVPTGKRFYPHMLAFSGVTAGGIAELVIARWLGSWDMSTNTFTDKGGDFAAVGSGQNRFWERLTARVRTTMSAVANTLTVTGLRSDNTSASPTFAFLASSPVNHALVSARTAYPPASAIAPDAMVTDWGWVGVSGIADNAAPTGIADIFGENVIAGGRHAANDSWYESWPPGSLWADPGDYIIVYGAQPAVTAYQREFYAAGLLTDVPA